MRASSEIRTRGAGSQVKDHRKLTFANLNTDNRSRDGSRKMVGVSGAVRGTGRDCCW
jgi:hypothetical protein